MTVSASAIKKTPLEPWLAKKIGIGVEALTREMISQYQLEKLRETIRWVYNRSPFYRELLKGLTKPELTCLADLCRFPFTTADDIRQYGLKFLCVSQGDISRVVTLDSSGTTGKAKRLYFTAFDQELTINFFQYGMSTLVEAGDRVLILLPGERPGSVGDLLAIALNRLGAETVPHGVVSNIPETLKIIAREKVTSLVGIPVQVLALARYADKVAQKSFHLKSVLLSTDHVPQAIVRELGRLWGCQVFEHYGMTEMGLGGGTSCGAHAGYHLHEADFYFEIVDPLTGEPLPEGQEGEVVVTTLTRQGMPLIRYRTGDISRFLSEPCGCGAILRRLELITQRTNSRILTNAHQYFSMADLDEALFAVDEVICFTAAVDNVRRATMLNISAATVSRPGENSAGKLDKVLDAVPAICQARQAGKLTVNVKNIDCGNILTSSTTKRAIIELERDDAK